jgi:hypothetical protein
LGAAEPLTSRRNPLVKQLRLLHGYALRERKQLQPTLRLGEGLVGQCALERQPILLTQPPADYVRIGSSLGETVPAVLALYPVLHNERLLAVVELAACRPIVTGSRTCSTRCFPPWR